MKKLPLIIFAFIAICSCNNLGQNNSVKENVDSTAIFRTKSNTKATAKKALEGWYKKVTKSTLREIKSVKQSIQHYEDEILNYFINRDTNASAESLNSKMKAFRSCLKGIRDIPFFFYRCITVFG